MAGSSFWQLHHSLPSCTFFEAILTALWSSYLVSTILINKLIIIFVLRDGLKFFWTIVLIYLLREAAAYLSHNLSVRELQLWSKGLVWRHPSTKAGYCVPLIDIVSAIVRYWTPIKWFIITWRFHQFIWEPGRERLFRHFNTLQEF